VRNIKLTIEYEGTNYQGWQVQGNAPTIQKTLEEAISNVVQHPVAIIGSGRTDSGVHALGQVASFSTSSEIPARNIVHAINSHLPPDVAVLAADDAAPDFHARYAAKEKTYRYRILSRDIRSPLLHDRAYHLRAPLDLDLMKRAARHLVGEHDFQAFQSKSPEAEGKSSVRTITRLDVERCGDLIKFHVTANGFLYNMVRAIVGTLIEVGIGKTDPDEVKRILDSKDRSLAGPTAPARGLCLIEVVY
jgi:tRNA pseudouridine38-40 synthase